LALTKGKTESCHNTGQILSGARRQSSQMCLQQR
jgi:hypothetical protein